MMYQYHAHLLLAQAHISHPFLDFPVMLRRACNAKQNKLKARKSGCHRNKNKARRLRWTAASPRTRRPNRRRRLPEEHRLPSTLF
jgi:hypothetical protein